MSQLSGIHVTYHVYGVGRLKSEMFNVWLKSSPNASWADLITALETMNEHRVAGDIAVHYSAAAGQSLTAGNVWVDTVSVVYSYYSTISSQQLQYSSYRRT